MTAISFASVYGACSHYVANVDTATLLDLLFEAVTRVRAALDELSDWGPAGTRSGQYLSDLAADEAALAVLLPAGLSVLSEESGRTEGGELTAVVDPIDGSTNAARGVPWFATSICVLDADGPLVALVVNQAAGTSYEAVRGGGARRDGAPLTPTRREALDEAVIGVAGYPPRYLGWQQYRALGAAALDLCLVAEGALDGYADFSWSGHAPWDYLGALLVLKEAGAFLEDAEGRDLVSVEDGDRRLPVAAGSKGLLSQLLAAQEEGPRRRRA
jgi:fructose-1,6-bisphosphatase/inositol monophosphatase family enzyme